MAIDAGLQRQVYASISERGAPIILRTVTTTGGPSPLRAPPIATAPAMAAAAAGDTTITLNARQAGGLLSVGDAIHLDGGQTVTVTAATASRAAGTGFDAVPIAPPLAQAHVAGAPVSFTWVADVKTVAMIAGFPRTLVDGTLIQSADVSVLVPAFRIQEPVPLSRIVVAGRERTIITVTPIYRNDTPVTYRLQAR